jgi:hypothetical protein
MPTLYVKTESSEDSGYMRNIGCNLFPVCRDTFLCSAVELLTALTLKITVKGNETLYTLV